MDRARWLRCLVLVPLLCWCVSSMPIQGQEDPRWDVFIPTPSGEGPADDEITCLVRDRSTLWVGTTRGLSRYDGGVWDTYMLDDEIQALLIDRHDYLWIGTKKDVLLLGPEQHWADRPPPLAGLKNIETLSLAGDEGVWVGTLEGETYRLLYVKGTGQQSEPNFRLNNTVEAIWENTVDDVWFGTRGGGLINSASLTRPYTESHGLPSSWVHSLWGDGQDHLWVGTEKGACRLSLTDPDAGCHSLDVLHGLAVTGLFPGLHDSVWVATDVGLWRFRYGRLLEEIWLEETIQPTRETSLHSDDVRAVVQDAEGQLWLGTTGGLARRRARVWKQLLPESPDLEPGDNNVQAIAKDDAGNLWVATRRGLKWRNPADPPDEWQSIKQLAGKAVRCLWEEDGSLWLCLESGIARVWPSGEVEFPANDQRLMDLTVHAIQRGPDGVLWFATRRGVWRWDEATWTEYLQDTPPGGPVNNVVYSIAPDGASGLWFGTLGGLSHFDGGQWSDPAQAGCPVKDPIKALAWDDQRGRLWIGTDAGLILCEKGQQPIRWDEHDGLINSDIRVLALGTETVSQTLWIGTFDGLSRANLSGEVYKQLPIVSFAGGSLPHDRVQAIYVNNDGVLIGTPNGLWAYQPSLAPPQVRLRHREHDTLLQPDQPLELAYNEPAALTAVGGDLRTPAEHLIYRYETTGKSPAWSLDGRLPVADDLRPGATITVAVRAYDRDFNPSVSTAELRVTKQRPPPWILAVVIAVVVTAVGIFVGYCAWWTRHRHPYCDLELRIAPGHKSGMHLIQLTARGGLKLLILRRKLSEANLKLARPWQRSPFSLKISWGYEHAIDWDSLHERLARLRADQTDEELLRLLGTQLYESVLSPEATAYLKQYLGLGRTGVRLRLRFEDAPYLDALPWEFMHIGEGFLTIESHVALVRDLSPERPEKTLHARKPLKLLVAWARPQDLSRLYVAEEVAAIEEAFAELVGNGQAVIQVLENARPKTFRQEVQKGYDLIHFIGHGGLKDGVGVLYFEDEDGDSVSMAQRELIALLAEVPTWTDKTPKLAVLNACHTADPGDIEKLTGLAAALVTEGRLLAAVGMGYPITTSSAAVFSQAFYDTLVRCGQVDHAVAKGREALFTLPGVGAGKRDWGVPRLYTRTPGGVIFDLSPWFIIRRGGRRWERFARSD